MKSKHCHPCAAAPFGRNNYFTGKLLVERDFTDEQWFHAAKLQYHQKHLHGSGVACGLKVRQHPNPACRDRIVEIEPGAAFDCCGRTIAVPEKVCFNFADAPAVAALREAKDTAPHTLQICVRYRECEAEPVPVLYDDCGDGSRCEPNRVIEWYEFDVTVDPPKPKHDPTAPKFAWKNTLPTADAVAVTLHEDSHRLYILTAGDPGTVFRVNTDNRDFLTPIALAGKGRALAVSKDGKAVVVAVSDTSGWKLWAFDAADMTKPPTELTLPTGTDGVELAVAPDGRLFGLVRTGGPMSVQTWGTSLLSATPVPPTPVVTAAPADARQPVFSTDGTLLYLLAPTSVVELDPNAASPTSVPVILPTGFTATPSSLVVAHDTAGDTLVLSGKGDTKLHFRAPDKTWSSADALLAPTAIVASSGGAWVYALTTDGTNFFVRAVSAHRALQGIPQPPNAVVKVGKQSQQLVLSASGATLFVPFLGDPTPTDGGVAVVDVKEQDCGELLWRSLDGCPACDGPDCVVLATVEYYNVGDKLEDATDPPSDPAADAANKISRIDNRTGRTILPSTQALTDVIRCMLENCHGGGSGKQGPPGQKGADGKSVTGADAVSVPWTDPADADFDPVTGKIHFKIPKGEPGAPGGTTPATKLTSICNINWKHAREVPLSRVREGLLIAFSGKVRAGDVNPHTFAVLMRRLEETPDGMMVCWCEMPAEFVGGVRLKPSDGACPLLELEGGPDPNTTDLVNGARFVPNRRFLPDQEYRVVLKGDLIRADAGDGTLRSLDANHLSPWVPSRPSGDEVEGGTFESWFRITQG